MLVRTDRHPVWHFAGADPNVVLTEDVRPYKQRKIRIIKPLRNQTYEYTRTIAGMYLEKKEYHNVARKQISLFMDYVRTHYRVPTNIINSRFFESLAARSGNTFDDTKELFLYLEKMEHQPERIMASDILFGTTKRTAWC